MCIVGVQENSYRQFTTVCGANLHDGTLVCVCVRVHACTGCIYACSHECMYACACVYHYIVIILRGSKFEPAQQVSILRARLVHLEASKFRPLKRASWNKYLRKWTKGHVRCTCTLFVTLSSAIGPKTTVAYAAARICNKNNICGPSSIWW